MTAAVPDALARVGRDGALELAFERRRGRTVLARARSTLPLQTLGPVALEDEAAVVSILNPTGGLVSGDRLSIDVHVGPAAAACLTTPSATRVYRAAAAPVVQEVAARVDDGAALEWVPDHTIPFPGSAFRQSLRVQLGADARLILVDAFAAGRVARGEAWTFALLESAVSVRDADGVLLHDRFRLTGEPSWGGLGRADGCAYFATLVVIAGGSRALAGALAGAVGARADVRADAAALPRRGVVVRCLARTAPALTDALGALWAAARREALGRPPLALRKP